MINIETRQNGKFKPGYPYNTTVDTYFKSLSTDFINNYGLPNIEINAINDHKNTVFNFDIELHEFIVRLSAFIHSFEQEGQVIIDDYDKLKTSYEELKNKVDRLSGNTTKTQDEFNFLSKNLSDITYDLEQINDMILFYQSQLIDESYTYSDSYISDAETRLVIINDNIDQTISDELYYENIVYAKTQEYCDSLDMLTPYGDYKAISIRNNFELWQQRSETYYKLLIEYFSDEYNIYWTYGKSLMYGEKFSISEGKKTELESVYEMWKQSLIKKYNFTLEKKIKEYSLNWLQNRLTFDMIDFTKAIEYEKKFVLKNLIIDVESIVIEKTQALRTVIPYNKEKNYFKYMEIVQLKREHIYKNIVTKEFDTQLLMEYDDQILLCESDYLYVRNKLNQPTYWNYFYDLERYTKLVNELKNWFDIVSLTITNNFKKNLGSNVETYNKIDFYTNEQDLMLKKIEELKLMKDKLEIELSTMKDELTITKSKMFEIDGEIQKKILEYSIYFTNRISFFIQNFIKTERDGIADLIDGNFYNELNKKFDIIKNYKSNVIWWDETDKKKLFEYYSFVLSYINLNIISEWEKEFSHEILANKKVGYYEYYVDRKITSIYAEIHKFVFDEKYNEIFEYDITKKLLTIKETITELVNNAFIVSTDIEINPDIFDYDDKFKFMISNGIETKENIIETINGFIDNILSYIRNKNLSFKFIEVEIDNTEKINSIWNDMEKKYV